MGALPNGPIQQPAPAGQGTQANEPREQTLAERLAEDQDRAELDAANQPTGAAEAPPEPQAPPPADALTARFDKLEQTIADERADRKMERQMLLGALNQARQPQRVVVEQPPVKPAEPPQPTQDQLLEALKSDPIGTINRISADAAAKAARETEERLTGQISDSSRRTTQAVAHQDQMRQGALAYQQQFNDVLQGPSGEEFDNECGREIVAQYGDDWQRRITPSTPVDIASRVYTRWVRAGKIATPTTNGQPKAGLREIIRSVPQGGATDRAAGSSGAPRGGVREPSTIGELGLTATEERAARRVMNQWGLDERTWVRNWQAAKADNPNYGNG